MAFNRPPQPNAPNTQNQSGDRIRIGGLYNAKTGNGINGGINMNYRMPDGRILGEALIEKIQESMEKDIPLRFLVFENNGMAGSTSKAPYSLHVASSQRQGTSPQPKTTRPGFEKGQRGSQGNQGNQQEGQYEPPDYSPDDQVDNPEPPVPVPQRYPPKARTAPRRA